MSHYSCSSVCQEQLSRRPRQPRQPRAARRRRGGRYAVGGYLTIYDGVIGPWPLPDFAAAVGAESLHCAVLLPAAGQCLRQVADRRIQVHVKARGAGCQGDGEDGLVTSQE